MARDLRQPPARPRKEANKRGLRYWQNEDSTPEQEVEAARRRREAINADRMEDGYTAKEVKVEAARSPNVRAKPQEDGTVDIYGTRTGDVDDFEKITTIHLREGEGNPYDAQILFEDETELDVKDGLDAPDAPAEAPAPSGPAPGQEWTGGGGYRYKLIEGEGGARSIQVTTPQGRTVRVKQGEMMDAILEEYEREGIGEEPEKFASPTGSDLRETFPELDLGTSDPGAPTPPTPSGRRGSVQITYPPAAAGPPLENYPSVMSDLFTARPTRTATLGPTRPPRATPRLTPEKAKSLRELDIAVPDARRN